MQELVIVVSDLYSAVIGSPEGHRWPAAPGLERMARFGALSRVDGGWRGWLARFAGLPGLATALPAAVAAAACDIDPGQGAWLATPVHLTPGLAGVQLGAQGLVVLEEDLQETLVREFTAAFGGTGHRLRPLPSGDFLLTGLRATDVTTTDPARGLFADLSAVLPSGPDAAELHRLGGEIELWLHEHPVNLELARRGRASISTLWIWGGGSPAAALRSAVPHGQAGALLPAAFGRDPFLAGLWHLRGTEALPPRELRQVLAHPVDRAVIVTHAFPLLDPRAPHAPADAVAAVDAQWISPALDAVGADRLGQLTVVVGDRCLTLRARDRFKLWRRPRELRRVLQ